jgi:hypothetical protein
LQIYNKLREERKELAMEAQKREDRIRDSNF